MERMGYRQWISGVAALGLFAGLSGCAIQRDRGTLDKAGAQLKQAAAQAEKAPPTAEAVSASLLPPVRGPLPRISDKQLQQRFDLLVTDTPIDQVLMGIVHGTRYSIMVKPKTVVPAAPAAAGAVAAARAPELAERLTVNLKNVTVFEALDSIREVYGYDYTVEGSRIYVQPPELQTRLYQVDYVIGQRRGVSDLQVIGGASVGSSSSGSGSSGSSSGSSSTSGSSTSGSSFSSVQASALSSIAKSDIWGEVEDAVRTALGCAIPRNLPRAGGAGGAVGAGGAAGGAAGGSTTGATRADVTFAGDTQSEARQRGVDGCSEGRAMAISQMSGTVMVRGMPNEHRMIEKMLKNMQLNVERQVIIEAKIIDVQLNSSSQQGINWGAFSWGLHRASSGANPNALFQGTTNPNVAPGYGGGQMAASVTSAGVATPTTLGGGLGTSLLGTTANNAFSAGLGLAFQFRNFSALIDFLQTQGDVHVLSSPRIATMNSQKAVIKVGTEEPFVASITPGTQNPAGNVTVVTSANLNYQPFFSGISLDVTPKIDDKGNITLHVHAMVNSIVQRNKVATPDANSVLVPFAVNTISQTDSVVKSRDGQVVVIGGLMTESMTDTRSQVPGVGEVPVVGSLFKKEGQQKVKRELVILLKPTVVKDDSTWNESLSGAQERVEGMGRELEARDRVPGAPRR